MSSQGPAGWEPGGWGVPLPSVPPVDQAPPGYPPPGYGPQSGYSPAGYPAPGYPPGPWGPPPYGYLVPRRTSGKAVTALVIGIVSIMPCYYIGFILGPIAIVLSRQAKREIAADPGADGDGLATAGFVTGIIGTVIGAILVLALVALIVVGAFADSSSAG